MLQSMGLQRVRYDLQNEQQHRSNMAISDLLSKNDDIVLNFNKQWMKQLCARSVTQTSVL